MIWSATARYRVVAKCSHDQGPSWAYSSQYGPVQLLSHVKHAYMAAMQATKEAAAQEALALRQEVEHVMARHQERVAKWEQAAAADEAKLNQKKGCHRGVADSHAGALKTGKVCDVVSQLHDHRIDVLQVIGWSCSLQPGCTGSLQSGFIWLPAAPQSGCNASQDDS